MKNKENSWDFESFLHKLNSKDQLLVDNFLTSLSERISLNHIDRDRMIKNFKSALMYLHGEGVSVTDCISRLRPAKLGTFYSQPLTSWYPLDYSAKIYPISLQRAQMAVFRLSVYLKEDVVPQVLQTAVYFTLKRFPFLAVSVKKGFFWHHIDTICTGFDVIPDNGRPCTPIRISQGISPALRIMYYKNRISVEFFHILTDGTGGMIFLKTLTAEYLRILGADIPCSDGVLDVSAATEPAEYSNDFETFYTKGKPAGFFDSPASQMSGKLTHSHPCRIKHFDMDSYSLLDVAHKKGVTVTALLVSAIMIATRAAMNFDKGNIHIQLPVNMRKFHPSSTLRNFAMYCTIRSPIKDVSDIDSILPIVSKQIAENASEEAMNNMLRATVLMVKCLKYIPLFIKRPVGMVFYSFLSDKVFSNTLSNLGVVKMPSEMAKYVEKFDFVLGTESTNRAACSLVTFSDHSVLSIEKLTEDPTFENKLYDVLTGSGIKIQVSESDFYGD